MSLDFESFADELRQVQSSQTDLSDPENTQLRAREERLSLRVCTVCYRPFSLLYNRRLLCSSCLLGICRSCAAFNTTLQTWQCFKCSKIRRRSERRVGWISGGSGQAPVSTFHNHAVSFSQTKRNVLIGSTGVTDKLGSSSSSVKNKLRNMETLASVDQIEVSRVTRSPMIKTVEFVTINCEPDGAYDEDTLSTSSSSRPSSVAMSSLSDKSMRSASVSPSPAHEFGAKTTPKIVIHEEIEEVVTTYSDDNKSSSSGDEIEHHQFSLNPYSTDKVEFPELGMELIEAGRDNINEGENHSFVVSVPDTSWQHNWLFRNHGGSEANSVATKMCPPVSMLVPNPSEVTKAQIGNKDFDLVSELSERFSVASFDVSNISSSEDNDEEMSYDDKVASEYSENKQEADQEYTIYEQLPVRKSYQSSPENNITVNNNNIGGDLKWISTPQNLTTHEGKIVTFMCQVSGAKPIDVAWFKKSEPIIISSKYWIYRKKDCHFLTIFDIKREDCGNYRLAAFNKTGEIWHSIELTVKGTRRAENPPEIIVHPENKDVKVGDTLEMVCQVQGYPEPRVEFYNNGRKISCNGNCTIEYRDHGEWAVIVKRAEVGLGGEWSVTAENRLGSSTRDWRLRVRHHQIQVQQVSQDHESASGYDNFYPVPSQNGQRTTNTISDKEDNKVRKIMEVLPNTLEKRSIATKETKLKSMTSVEKGVNDSIVLSKSPEEVDPAPKPGSLADREHRKWIDSAIKLRNNPYSKENIDRRNISRSSSFLENKMPPVSTTTSGQQRKSLNQEDYKIYCGLKSVPATRYNRDYFINNDDDDRLARQDISFSPEETVEYDTQHDHYTEESVSEEHSEEKDNDSLGDSKHWDSGVGSSSERTSTFSVSEGIRRFERDFKYSEHHPLDNLVVGSVDSLLSVHEEAPPMLPDKMKSKYRRLEQSSSPPPQPSKRSMLKQKKVTYANENETGGSNMRALKDQGISSNNLVHEDIVNEYDDEHHLYSTSIPRLPSVKDLAAMFQPKLSPEPKPRKSLTKKKCFDQRITKGNRIVPSHYQTHVSTNNTFARSNNKLQEFRVCKTTDTIEEEVDDDQDIPSPTPLAAKLKADGVSVSYQVPGPPLIPKHDASSRYSDLDEDDYSQFLMRVRNTFPTTNGDSLKRSDTSSATLPVTWSSSSIDRKSSESESSPFGSGSPDSILEDSSQSPQSIQGPVILLGENFEPQVMTEDCQPCPREYSSPSTSNSSSTSGSMFYATFIPDRCINGDEVSIVCNEFTQIETDSHATDTTTDSDDQSIVAAVEPKKYRFEEKPEKNWTSTIRLPSLLDFWENRNKDNSQFKKYASESNICKNQELPENGLRKIPKEKNFTSCEESFNEDSDYSVRSGYEDHIYEEVSCNKPTSHSHGPEESGFFSYDNPSLYRLDFGDIEEEPSDIDDDLPDPSAEHCYSSGANNDRANNVTVIAVDYSNTTNINQANNNIESCSDKNVSVITLPPAPVQFSSTSVKDLRKLFEKEDTTQVHNSLTARSVSRVLKDGAKSTNNKSKKVHPGESEYYNENHHNQVHIVYDSRSDGRSESPEHSGIPAIPVPVFSKRQSRYGHRGPGADREGYTSDESSLSVDKNRYVEQRRKHSIKKDKIIWA